MDVRKTAIERNPFLGLFLRANESLALAPIGLPEKTQRQLEEGLGVTVVKLLVNQSNLLGIYCALNSKGIIVPSFAEAKEVQLLKDQGLNVYKLDSQWGAAGNNILVNDHAALINPALPSTEAKKIADCLGVEAAQGYVSGIPTVGSINVVTNKGLLAYNRITDIELKRLESLFKVTGLMGSANLGVPFVGIWMVANTNGALMGDMTSGVEVQRTFHALSGETT